MLVFKRGFGIKNEKGFTLLELLIVIFLITLTVGIGSVFLAGAMPSKRINSVAMEISAAIRSANTSARVDGETKTLLFDMDRRYYGFEKKGLKKIPDGINIKIVDPLLGELIRGKYPITFDPFGSTSGVVIVLYDSSRAIRIEIDPIVGAILVK